MSTISTFGARPVRARWAARPASAAARWPACTSTGSRVGATAVVSAVIGSRVIRGGLAAATPRLRWSDRRGGPGPHERFVEGAPLPRRGVVLSSSSRLAALARGVIGDPRGRPSEQVTATGGRALLAAVLARTAAGERTDDATLAADLEEGLDDVRSDLEQLIGRGLLAGTVIRAFDEGAPLRVRDVEVTAEGRRALGPTGP